MQPVKPETEKRLSRAYMDGRATGDALVECYRPEGLEHLTGLPDSMGLIADAINQQQDDATGSACLYGVVNAFTRELIRLNKLAFEQEREIARLRGEVH